MVYPLPFATLQSGLQGKLPLDEPPTRLAAVRERLEKQVMTAEMALRSSMSILGGEGEGGRSGRNIRRHRTLLSGVKHCKTLLFTLSTHPVAITPQQMLSSFNLFLPRELDFHCP